MSILDTILAIIAPHVCLGCGYEGTLLCSRCVALLPPPLLSCIYCEGDASVGSLCEHCRMDVSLDAVWAVTGYEGLTRQLVHSLKYARAQAAARVMASLMTVACPYGPANEWVVAHAPTTAARVRTRGYDQARLLARAMAQQLACPSLVLLRRTSQLHQIGATGEQRRKQMTGAFQVCRPGVVKNAKILLVDDVITTGATMEAAAQALCKAGAQCVEGVVFARAGSG